MSQHQPELPEPAGALCRPSRPWVIAGVAVTVALAVAWLMFGRTIMAAINQPGETLLSVVDVFRCCILTWKALTIMLPAFLLGGAVAAFAPSHLILKYLGTRSHPARAYATAAVSGCVLSLCSCNIVPLFVSILRRGAGIGPAFTFLFAGPAINIVAAIFTIQVIGWQLGLWRLIGVPVIAVIIGLLMAAFYRRESRQRDELHPLLPGAEGSLEPRLWLLFLILIAMVLFGAWQSDLVFPAPGSSQLPASPVLLIIGLGILTAALLALMFRAFDAGERRSFMGESWGLVKLVVPVLLPAVLVIGAIAAFVDVKLVYQLVGQAPEGAGLWASLRPILLASIFGELMYFPILTEVAFTKAFLKLGMDVGPALALLIAGPGSSLPGFLIIGRAIGWRKAALYELLLVVVTTAYAAIFASEVGDYICACMMQ